MVFNSDVLNLVQNNHTKTEWVYLREMVQSKKISNDHELIQSYPTSCPQNQKGNNLIHKLTAVYDRHSR